MGKKIKIELLVARAGPGLSQQIGDIAEVDAAEAKRMIESGQAKKPGAAVSERAAPGKG